MRQCYNNTRWRVLSGRIRVAWYISEHCVSYSNKVERGREIMLVYMTNMSNEVQDLTWEKENKKERKHNIYATLYFTTRRNSSRGINLFGICSLFYLFFPLYFWTTHFSEFSNRSFVCLLGANLTLCLQNWCC